MARISADSLNPAIGILQRGIEVGAMPGATVIVMCGGEIVLHAALGTLDGIRPVTRDTRYDLASLTKPMATGAALLTLLEAGDISLLSPAADFIHGSAPSFNGVTVGHLLYHTSGLPAWAALYENGLGLDAAIETILKLPRAEVNTKYTYSCLNFILLQKIIETATGVPLDVYACDAVLAPLGLANTGFAPDAALLENIAPTVSQEGSDKGEMLIGIVHDENARGIGGVSGNAGLFGTVNDVAIFGEAIRTGTFFSAPTTARIFANQVDPRIGAHTFLFFASGNGLCPSGDLLSSRTVGHSGFTGTFLTIDPAYDLVVAVLTNSVFIDGKTQWLSLRRRFLNTVAAALVV